MLKNSYFCIMEQILDKLHIDIPVTDPILIFSLVLFVILFTPLLFNKMRIPHIIGLILAGIALGENGFGILNRDVSFELFGAVGLLYIMFLAGLQIDLTDFKKNMKKSMFFGLMTFAVPMILGTITSYYLLKHLFLSIYSEENIMTICGNISFDKYLILASLLIASMYASHTLISYPIVGRYGVTKNSSVNISIGGTMITTTLALFILAVIVAICHGNYNQASGCVSSSASYSFLPSLESAILGLQTDSSNIMKTASYNISSSWQWFSWVVIWPN